MNKPEFFNELARSRRSVFPDQFIPGKRVDDAIIKEILTNATWAPDHGHSSPWRFTVFTGEGLQKFGMFQSELYKAEAGDNFKEATFLKLQTNPLKASHIISIGMKRTTSKPIPEIEDVIAVACAIQNIYLSVTAYGLGGYLTTGGVTYKPTAKTFLGLGDHDKLLGFFYIGHVAIPSPATHRIPLGELLTWIK
jgi:nitroreductase